MAGTRTLSTEELAVFAELQEATDAKIREAAEDDCS